MRRIHVEAFKMAPKKAKSLLVPKGTGPGVYTVTDPFGTETVPKLDLLFWDLIGKGLTVR